MKSRILIILTLISYSSFFSQDLGIITKISDDFLIRNQIKTTQIQPPSATDLTFLENQKINLIKNSKWEIDYSTLGSWDKTLPFNNIKKRENSSSITSSGVLPEIQSGSTFSINCKTSAPVRQKRH